MLDQQNGDAEAARQITQQRGERSRLTAMREGCALAGVMLAAVLPTVAGLTALSIAFAVLLLVASVLEEEAEAGQVCPGRA